MATRRRALTTVLLALLAGAAVPIPASPAAAAAPAETTTTLSAVDRGWVSQAGLHPDDPNYAAGPTLLPHGRLRNFFVFDLSGISGTVVAGRVSAVNPYADQVADSYTLREVTTAPAFFGAQSTDATAVWEDLGTGPVYGSVTLADAQTSPVVVPLNEAGLGAVQAAVGSSIAFGGDYAPSETGAGMIFGRTDGLPPSAVQLTLTVRPATLQNPYTVWTQPTTTPLDGIGTWVATANDPAPAPGQLPPSYLYGLGFRFTGTTALGFVGLVTSPAGKFAVASVVGPDGVTREAVVPFAWTAGRLYFPFVYRLGADSWGVWVYDEAAATWAPVGLLSLPAAWGKLTPQTATAVGWTGPPAPTCGAYPHADVFIQAPLGFVGSSVSQATAIASGATPGDCAPGPGLNSPPWAHYRVGAQSLLTA